MMRSVGQRALESEESKQSLNSWLPVLSIMFHTGLNDIYLFQFDMKSLKISEPPGYNPSF